MATSPAEIEQRAMEFYKSLFTTQQDLETKAIYMIVPQKVSMEMNKMLTRPYSVAEVERALNMMKPNKAPGPDGFTAGFQLHWGVVGADITKAVLSFLNGGVCPDNLNKTTIVLIPKTRNP